MRHEISDRQFAARKTGAGVLVSGQQVNIVILQGPLGPFFADLAAELEARGCRTHRICFNKGDRHYAHADHIVAYGGPPDEWADWLNGYLKKHRVSAVCCYGDSRFYHRKAGEVCRALSLPFYCFEEGYVRPGFVTLEEGGNNANSPFPRRFREGALADTAPPSAADIGNAFRFQFWFATIYYIVKDWKLFGFARYRHHRHGNWSTEMMAWLIAGFRKNLMTRRRERGLTDRLVAAHGGQLFLVPLQVAVDSQMVHHSPFDSVEQFIEQTIRSFAHRAPDTAHLLIKHHPMDRGFRHYGRLINKLARKHKCAEKITYAFDVDLKDILDAAAGCVTVNSTVGLQALEQGVPTLTLGTSMIAEAGLTADVPLDSFWTSPGEVDTRSLNAFKAALLSHTQQPGSFYRDRKIATRACTSKILAQLGREG